MMRGALALWYFLSLTSQRRDWELHLQQLVLDEVWNVMDTFECGAYAIRFVAD